MFPATNLSLKSVEDEVQKAGVDTFDALLHNVIAVLVLDALEHMAVQLFHHLHLEKNDPIISEYRGRLQSLFSSLVALPHHSIVIPGTGVRM